MFLPNQTRLKALYDMGQVSSQANGQSNTVDSSQVGSENMGEAGGTEIGGGRSQRRKKRKSAEGLHDLEESQINGGIVPGHSREKSRKRKKRKTAESEELPHEINGAGLEHSGEKSRKHKKRKSTNSEDALTENQPADEEGKAAPADEARAVGEEAESALTLLQLRNGVQYDEPASPQAVNEDDAAAAAQLVKESSPVAVKEKPRKAVINGVLATDDKAGHPGAKHSSKVLKGRMRRSSSSDDMLPKLSHELHEVSKNVNRNGYLPMPVARHSELPRSTLSLDDIDSDDESVAALLRGYQDTMPGPEGDSGEDDSNSQLALDAFEKATAAAIAPASVDSPDDISVERAGDIQGKKGKKRAKHSSKQLAEDDNDTELHPKLQQVRRRKANKRTIADKETPIDPQLTGPEYSVMQLENYRHSDPLPTEHTKPGKLKRLSTRMRGKNANSQSNTMDRFVYHTPATQVYDVAGIEAPSSLRGNEPQPSHDSDLELTTMPTPRRKKRRLPDLDGDYSSTPNPHSSNRTLSSQRSRNHNPPLAELATKGGPFTSSEVTKIYNFRDTYCTQHDWNHRKFADTIQSNARNVPKLNTFWSEICALLPYRGRQAIQKFCRRQFHNFGKRGVWTESDDEKLRQAVAEKGTSWKAVSEICERHPEDVRDRWRNYIYNAENRNTKDWTDAEVKSLCQAVGECIWLMREERRARREAEMQEAGFVVQMDEEAEEAELEGLVHWQVVSDRMGGMRGRLQCSAKWKQLKNAGRADFARMLRKAGKVFERLESGRLEEPEYPSKDWRARRARKRVEVNMRAGDRYDLLMALLGCGAQEEEGIKWMVLGKGEEWRGKWNVTELKAAWEMLKEEGGEVWDLGEGYVEAANRLLTRLMKEEAERLEERWVPPKSQMKEKESRKKSTRRPRKSNLSNEFVYSSQAEEDNEDAAEEDGGVTQTPNEITVTSNDDRSESDNDSLFHEEVDAAPEQMHADVMDAETAQTHPEFEEAEDESEEDDDARLIRQLQLLRDA